MKHFLGFYKCIDQAHSSRREVCYKVDGRLGQKTRDYMEKKSSIHPFPWGFGNKTKRHIETTPDVENACATTT